MQSRLIKGNFYADRVQTVAYIPEIDDVISMQDEAIALTASGKWFSWYGAVV